MDDWTKYYCLTVDRPVVGCRDVRNIKKMLRYPVCENPTTEHLLYENNSVKKLLFVTVTDCSGSLIGRHDKHFGDLDMSRSGSSVIDHIGNVVAGKRF